MIRNAALITGAGSSARMGTGGKKEYRLIEGLPVLARSVTAFLKTGLFAHLAVTVPRGEIDRARALVAPFVAADDILFVEGGETRRESVYRGLSALAGRDGEIEYVLIHDAARPWVTAGLIRAVLEAVAAHGAAVPATDSADALVEADAEGRVLRHLAKDAVRSVQTPQGFRFREILEAHRELAGEPDNFYDDAQVLMRTGRKVKIIPGDPVNRKITFAHDLERT